MNQVETIQARQKATKLQESSPVAIRSAIQVHYLSPTGNRPLRLVAKVGKEKIAIDSTTKISIAENILAAAYAWIEQFRHWEDIQISGIASIDPDHFVVSIHQTY